MGAALAHDFAWDRPMKNLSRRDFIQLSIAASASVALAIDPSSSDIHPELLELASRFERHAAPASRQLRRRPIWNPCRPR